MSFFDEIKIPKSYYLIDTLKQVQWLVEELNKSDCYAFDIETNHATTKSKEKQLEYKKFVRPRIAGISFSWGRKKIEDPWNPGLSAYIPLGCSDDSDYWKTNHQKVVEHIKEALLNDSEKVAHNGNFDKKWIYKEWGFFVKNFNFDTMLAKGLLDEDSLYCSNALKSSFNKEGEITKLGCSDYFLNIEGSEWKKDLENALDHYDPDFRRYTKVPLETLYPYACADTDLTLSLKFILQEKLEKEELKWLFDNVTMPFTHSILIQELNGISIHIPTLEKYSKIQKRVMEDSSKKVFDVIGREFDIASPKQLGELLFNELLIEGGDRNKTGWIVDEEALSKVNHPVIEPLMEWRKASKLDSTYLEGNLKYIEEVTHEGEFGWVHPNYFLISKTGRAKAHEPNITNVIKPDREEEEKTKRPSQGSYARGIYVAPPGYSFLMADFCSQEIMVAALASQEKVWIEALNNKADIHATTAKKVFKLDCSVDEVKEIYPTKRKAAKTVNFGIIYGESSYGLSQSLGISVEEADELIFEYFEGLPDLKKSIDATHEFLLENGYVVDLFGRRRHLPVATKKVPRGIFYKREEVPKCYRKTVAPYQIGYTSDDIFELSKGDISNAIYKKELKQFYKCRNCNNLKDCFINSEISYLNGKINRAKRQCYNFIIQGSSASISQLSHVWVNRELQRYNMPATLSGFVHDELITICRDDVIDNVKQLLRYCMVDKIMKVLNSNVQFDIDYGVKKCWAGDIAWPD